MNLADRNAWREAFMCPSRADQDESAAPGMHARAAPEIRQRPHAWRADGARGPERLPAEQWLFSVRRVRATQSWVLHWMSCRCFARAGLSAAGRWPFFSPDPNLSL